MHAILPTRFKNSFAFAFLFLLFFPALSRAQEDFSEHHPFRQVRGICLDPGHGGDNWGTVNADHQSLEKEVDMAVALKVKKLLKRQKGLSTWMMPPGENKTAAERVAFANARSADLFVSIECCPDCKHGTVVWLENFAVRVDSPTPVPELTEKEVNQGFDTMMTGMHQCYCQARSLYLAELVGEQIQNSLKQPMMIRKDPRDGLNQLTMPGIRVEMDSYGNKQGARNLADPRWQDEMAQAIVQGIVVFRKKIDERLLTHPEEEIPAPLTEAGLPK
jgi:N-acetylmuramoyl-L-alanine amidase